jgi:hypothetical protein
MEGTNQKPQNTSERPQRHSPAVYRRRRLAAFLVCGLLLIGVVKVFANLTGGSSPAGHTETSTAQAAHGTPAPTPSAARSSAAPNSAPVSSLAGVTACSPAALSVRAGILRYQVHKPFVLPVTVQLANRLGTECVLDTSRLAVIAQSGSTAAWNSQGCSIGANGQPTGVASSSAGTSLLVPAGRTVDWTVRWPAAACTGPLQAGMYDISARLDDGVLTGWAGTVTVS